MSSPNFFSPNLCILILLLLLLNLSLLRHLLHLCLLLLTPLHLSLLPLSFLSPLAAGQQLHPLLFASFSPSTPMSSFLTNLWTSGIGGEGGKRDESKQVERRQSADS